MFAVPGNITSPNSKGTNELIKNGAKLVNRIEDILEEFNIEPICREKSNTFDNRSCEISAEERLILELLHSCGGDRDEIAAASGLQTGKAMAALTMLEVKGLIRQTGGNYHLV